MPHIVILAASLAESVKQRSNVCHSLHLSVPFCLAASHSESGSVDVRRRGTSYGSDSSPPLPFMSVTPASSLVSSFTLPDVAKTYTKDGAVGKTVPSPEE